MEIKILNEDLYEDYENFLLSDPRSLFYHSIKYKNFLEDLLGCESRYLLAYENNKIIAALPLMIKDGPLGKVINSLPYYGSNGGIIGDSHNKDAISLFKNDLSLMEYASLTMVSSPTEDSISELFSTFTDQRISQITPLDPDSDDYDQYIFSVIESSTRRNIRKAQNLNIKVSIQNEKALPFLEQVHNENMLSIGGKAKSPDFFSKIRHHFEPMRDYKVYVAESEGISIAGLLLFFYNKTVEYFTPVIQQEHREKQALGLLVFEAMKDSMAKGYNAWNWGGTWLTQTGVYQFKKKWGAIEKSYHYATIIKNSNILSVDQKILMKAYDGFYIYNFSKIK